MHTDFGVITWYKDLFGTAMTPAKPNLFNNYRSADITQYNIKVTWKYFKSNLQAENTFTSAHLAAGTQHVTR